jgi:hypothetical protein
MNPIVHYTQADLDYLTELAHGRNDPKVDAGVHNKKYAKNKGDVEVNVDGLLGEFAFHKFSGLPLRTDTSLSGERPGGKWDFRLRDGRTVEVRYRAKRWYEFALHDDNIDSFNTDVGVLVTPGLCAHTLDLRGWCSYDDFARLCFYMDFGFGRRLVIRTDDLCTDWSSFL